MKALVLVDLQNDFVPAGALPVPNGNEVVPVANGLLAQFSLVVATRDWHPANHGSFAANHAGKRPGDRIDLGGLEQVLWPVHCVQGTRGAEFVPELRTDGIERVFLKGTDPEIDSYSGFFDNGHRKATGLSDYLNQKSVTAVYILGLATDYCVKFTALDAVALNFKTTVIEDACRGIEMKAGDVSRALAEMQKAGVKIVQSHEIFKGASDLD